MCGALLWSGEGFGRGCHAGFFSISIPARYGDSFLCREELNLVMQTHDDG